MIASYDSATAILTIVFLLMVTCLLIYGAVFERRKGSALFLLVLPGCISMWLCHYALTADGYSYGDGNRTGYVIKLSKKGVFWKTWEGEMQLGGFTTTQGGSMSAQTWDFSTTSDDVAKQLQEALLDGKRVRLEYRELFMRGVALGNTSYDVVKVDR